MKNRDSFDASYIRVEFFDGKDILFGSEQDRDGLWFLGLGDKFIEIVSNSDPQISKGRIRRNYIPINNIKQIITTNITIKNKGDVK